MRKVDSCRGTRQLVIGRLSSARAFLHLPPGHEPGGQSLRNRYAFPFWEWAIGLVGSGLVIGVFLAAGGRGPKFVRRSRTACLSALVCCEVVPVG